MKKEQQVAALLALLLAYSIYSWFLTFYALYSGDSSYGIPPHFVFYCSILLVGLAGLIQFYATGFKKSQLLKLYLIYLLTSSLFGYIPTIFRLVMMDQGAGGFFPMVTETAGLVITFFGLSVIAHHRTPKVQEARHEDGSIALHYVPASKGSRFLNRFLDMLLLVVIIYNHYQWWEFAFRPYFEDAGELTMLVTIVLMEYVLIVAYYVVTEYFFHTTFGKVLTQTTVIHAQGGYPSFSTILVRSLCRFIPFDSLSFLFGDRGGWHDRLSSTGVVQDKYVD